MNRTARLAGLDGLRGLAALAVFGVHYNQIVNIDVQLGPVDVYRLFSNGEYGVALFFILSGLLLSLPFWKSHLYGADWPSGRTYIIRRLARILPAYYLALTLLVLLTGYWRYAQAWPDILLHYSFLFNYAEFSIFSINAPFWTLAVEVQFYVFLPFLFLVLRRFSAVGCVLLLLLFAATAYGLNYWLVSSLDRVILWPGSSTLVWIRPYGAVVTHSLLAHLPHFIIGIIAGALFLLLRASRHRACEAADWYFEAMFWIPLVLVVLLLSTDLGDRIHIPYGRYGLPLVPVLLGAMILSAPFTTHARQLLDTGPIRILGTLSYGVYIFHLPVLRLVDQTMLEAGMDARAHWLLLAVASLALTLLAATISWILVERPALRLVHRKP